jgi:hypothetical protein
VKESTEPGWRFGQIAEEGSGDEKEVDQKIKRDCRIMGSGAVGGTVLQATERFDCGAKIEAADEALSGERVVHGGAELTVEANGEEQSETKVEGIGPDNRRKTTKGKG